MQDQFHNPVLSFTRSEGIRQDLEVRRPFLALGAVPGSPKRRRDSLTL